MKKLSDDLERRGLEVRIFCEDDSPGGEYLEISRKRTGSILATVKTPGEVRAFLTGYLACRKDFRDLMDEES